MIRTVKKCRLTPITLNPITPIMTVTPIMTDQGGSVDLPDDVDVVAFEDLVSNFPFVMHSGENSVSDAQVTLAAIREIVNAVSKTGENRMLGFHIGISYHDRDAFFSFVGQIGDVMEWINSECTSLPSDVSEVRNWATLNSQWLTETFPRAREIPPLGKCP